MENVLFLAEELRIGGAETYFYLIENRIDRSKINFYSMAVNGSEYNRLTQPKKYFEYSFSPINRLNKIYQVCKKKHINVIHANSLQLAVIASIIKKIGNKNITIIYTKHNLTRLEKMNKKMYVNFLNKNIDLVNVICIKEKNELIKWGVKEEKIKVIYNGINIDEFPYKPHVKSIDNKIKIGILARLDKVKNHTLFLSIAKKLHTMFPNTEYYIGGDGEEKSDLLNIVKNEKMDDYVHFCGYVKANSFLQKIDYLLLVSKREVLPISIIEAMASGVIVVSKEVGGVNELIDSSIGYLVKGENEKDYLKAFSDSFSSNNENEKTYLARKKVEKMFSINTTLSEIENLYLEINKRYIEKEGE